MLNSIFGEEIPRGGHQSSLVPNTKLVILVTLNEAYTNKLVVIWQSSDRVLIRLLKRTDLGNFGKT